MTADDGDLRDVYQRATRRRDRDDCPSEELVMNAARNTASSRDRERVAEHVAQCSDCARDFRIARSLVPWAEEASKRDEEEEHNLSPFAIAATVGIAVTIPLIVWLFLARTGSSRAIDHLNMEIGRRDQEIRALRLNAMAMRSRLEQQVTPEIGAPIVDLDRNNPKTIDAGNARSFTVVVHVPFARTKAFELRDKDDRLLWRGIPSVSNDAIPITIPRELAPAGDYLLHAIADKDRAEFRFTIR